MSHGFITAVVGQACGDRHKAPQEANPFETDSKYADVIAQAEAAAYFARLG